MKKHKTNFARLLVALAIGPALMYCTHADADANTEGLWNLQGLSDIAIAIVQPKNESVISDDARPQLASDIKAKLRSAGITVVPHESSKAILEIYLQSDKTANGDVILIQLSILEEVTMTSRGLAHNGTAITYMDQELIEVSQADIDRKIHDVLVSELTPKLTAHYQEQRAD